MGFEKEKLRERLVTAGREESEREPEGGWGKAAERLRRLAAYRSAANVFVSLDPDLRQVQLNVLSDRKRLILPTPWLQHGFLLLDPQNVPVQKRSFAIRPHSDNPFARKIPYDAPLRFPIDLIVTGATAAGTDGGLLGDGHGHLDLQVAILSTLGWLAPNLRLVALVSESCLIEPFPLEETDVKVHWIVTPQRAFETNLRESLLRRIRWERLSAKQIRRNEALYQLNRRREADSKEDLPDSSM